MNYLLLLHKKADKLISSFSLHQWLLLSAGFSCILLLIRMVVTGWIEYIFLPWNLFLGFVPYLITRWMTTNVSILEYRLKSLLLLVIWLLFIPNAFYIITDLFHFTQVRSAPKWFDLLLIFSFAWNGLVAGMLSIQKMELVLKFILNKTLSIPFMFLIMWLCGLGIYIGRYLRFNSWDVVTNPFSLAGELIGLLIHPFQNSIAWGMTGCYAVFMTLAYYTIKKSGEATLAGS
jgi:uncharacterized membrane protein